MSDYRLTDVGVDYFTATTRNHGIGEAWWERFKKWADVDDNKVEQVRDWGNKWYSGKMCNKVYWGRSEMMGYIIMAQGGVAKDLWLDLMPEGGASVTRMDLQVTCLLPNPKEEWARILFDRAMENKGRKSTLIQNSRGGSTLYVGSRHSDQFGRVYDKGAQQQSHLDGLLWRYECQINKPRSDVLAKEMMGKIKDNKVDQIKLIHGYVYRWFNARGVSTLFGPQENLLVVEVGKSISTAEKKMTWLRTQVQPTVRRLIAAGHLKDTIEALGVTYTQLQMIADTEGEDARELDKNK